MNKLNLSNRRFGRLTAIKENGRSVDGSVLWLCKCDCGNYINVRSYHLNKGYNVKSCGCLRSEKNVERFRLKIKSGQRFGRLSVIEFIKTKGKKGSERSVWRCKCDCGNEIAVYGSSLLSGNTKSCGCYRRDRFDKVRNDSKKENNPNWKGGITDFYQQIYQFLRYDINWQNRVFKKDNYTCRRCGKYGGKLNAHHVITVKIILNRYNITTMYEVKNCGLLLDVDNGITLCLDCHNWVHSDRNLYKEYLDGF